MSIRSATAALLGVSTYTAKSPVTSWSLSDAEVRRFRALYGGQLSTQPISRTRWYPEDVERAELSADNGNLALAAQLMRAARKDGTLSGVLSTRTDGLVRLAKRFAGDGEMVADLEGREYGRSRFDDMFPPQELALLAGDGLTLGVGVGEFQEVEGRDFPVFVRLDPAGLRYRWNENRWYYASLIGEILITPGDGKWVLHTPGGRNAPWQNGLWRALGKAYIRKEHANLHKDNWEAKLANPARVAFAAAGAADEESDSWFRQVMAWGVNTVFALKPGYDVKLLESNGRGADSFVQTIKDCNGEFIIAIAGQTVTTDGGTGFANADVHKSIRADLIKSTADSLAHTVNTQGIPVFVAARYGEDAIERSPAMEWDVRPPRDLQAEATTISTLAQAIGLMADALKRAGSELDIPALCRKFGVPVLEDFDGDGQRDQTPAKDRPKLKVAA